MNSYVVKCPDCGGLVGLCSIDPRWAKSTADSVAEWIRDGYTPVAMTKEETTAEIEAAGKFSHRDTCPRIPAKLRRKLQTPSLPFAS